MKETELKNMNHTMGAIYQRSIQAPKKKTSRLRYKFFNTNNLWVDLRALKAGVGLEILEGLVMSHGFHWFNNMSSSTGQKQEAVDLT